MAGTTSSISERNLEAEKAVFQNPLLLDNIVRFVLYEDKYFENGNLRAVRLVAKSWLQSASRLIKKMERIVFQIVLESDETDNSINFKRCDKTTKELLDKLVSTFGSDSCHPESFLSLNLIVNAEVFGNSNSESLKTVFEQCGKILFRLHVNIYTSQRFVSREFGILNFPNLRWIRYCLYNDLSNNPVSSDIFCGTSKVLQTLTNGAPNLKSFEFSSIEEYAEVVNLFMSIKLPQTVTKVESWGNEFIWDYKLLMNNYLPNLKKLRMCPLSQPTDEQMLEILDRFRTSLKSLHINQNLKLDTTDSKTFITFPLMEKLESVRINRENYELEPNTKIAVSKQMPKLRKLSLDSQNELNLLQWIEKSKYENVHVLELTVEQNNSSDVKSPSLELMKGFAGSFPNVRSLTLNLNYEDTTTLKLLFAEWTQLQNLKLTFSGNVSVNTTPDLLTSVFLGAPLDKIHELKNILKTSSGEARRTFLDDALQGLNTQESIVNLAELESLSLVLNLMVNLPDALAVVFKSFWCVLVYAALMKMPNLKKKYVLIKKGSKHVDMWM